MTDSYPDIPGAKGTDGTSQDAAEAIAPTVSHLRRIAMRSRARLGEATPLEAVAFSGVTRESLQPRFSELREAAAREIGAKIAVPIGNGDFDDMARELGRWAVCEVVRGAK